MWLTINDQFPQVTLVTVVMTCQFIMYRTSWSTLELLWMETSRPAWPNRLHSGADEIVLTKLNQRHALDVATTFRDRFSRLFNSRQWFCSTEPQARRLQMINKFNHRNERILIHLTVWTIEGLVHAIRLLIRSAISLAWCRLVVVLLSIQTPSVVSKRLESYLLFSLSLCNQNCFK